MMCNQPSFDEISPVLAFWRKSWAVAKIFLEVHSEGRQNRAECLNERQAEG
jgi:hypothetical protein